MDSRCKIMPLLVSTLMVVLGGCGTKEESSGIHVQFPDWEAMRAADIARQSKVSSLAVSAEELDMVVVNVTGPGIAAPIMFRWERHDENAPPPPTQISLTVPRGDARLVQVLALYEGQNGMDFYYDDESVNLTSDSSTVALTLANIASTAVTTDGDLVGRYLTEPQKGPTGKFQYRFNPGGGKPTMVVHVGEMFSGWVNLKILSNTFLSYSRLDGTPMFSGLTNESTAWYNSAKPEAALRIALPKGYRDNNGDPNAVALEAVPQRRLLVGYFGPGVQEEKVCLQSFQNSIDVPDASIKGLYTDLAGLSPVKWSGKSPPSDPNSQAYVESLTVNSAPYQGGSDLENCATTSPTDQSNQPQPFVDFLKINHTQLGWSDSVLGFRGPFRKYNLDEIENDEYLHLEYDSAAKKMTVHWQYLPGAATDLNGLTLFFRMLDEPWRDDDLRGKEGYRCNHFSNASAFAPVFQKIAVSKDVQTIAIPNVSSEEDAKKLQIVACPIGSDGKYFNSAVMGTYQSGGGTPPVATKLVAVEHTRTRTTSEANPAQVSVGTCYPIHIYSANNDDQKVPYSASLQLKLVEGERLSSDSACNGDLSNSLAIQFESETTVYLKEDNVGSAGQIKIEETVVNQLQPLRETSFYYQSAIANAAATQLVTMAPDMIYAHDCVPVQFQLRDDEGVPAAADLDVSLNSSKLSFYEDSGNCDDNSILSSLSFSGSQTTRNVRMKYTGHDQAVTIVPTVTVYENNIAFPQKTVSVKQPGAPTQLSFQSVPENFAIDSCPSVKIYLHDSNGRPTTVNADVQVTLIPANNGSFYGNLNCSEAIPNNQATIVTGQTHIEVWYRQSSASSDSITLKAQAQVGQTTITGEISGLKVTPPPSP